MGFMVESEEVVERLTGWVRGFGLVDRLGKVAGLVSGWDEVLGWV